MGEVDSEQDFELWVGFFDERNEGLVEGFLIIKLEVGGS